MIWNKGWKFIVKQKEVMRVGDCFNVFLKL
jgi:hypothetical protein